MGVDGVDGVDGVGCLRVSSHVLFIWKLLPCPCPLDLVETSSHLGSGSALSHLVKALGEA